MGRQHLILSTSTGRFKPQVR